MNYRLNLINNSLLIGLALLMPVASSAIPLQNGNTTISESKPLEPGMVKPDWPLPAEDIRPKPDREKRSVCVGGLSQSQIRAMTTILQNAKKVAIKGKLKDALEVFNEFAGGPWEEAAKELKIKSPIKHDSVITIIYKIDDIYRKRSKTNTRILRLKFIKEITSLINAVDKAGSHCV